MAMSEYDKKRVASFSHLWKEDNKEWVKQRKAEAKYIAEHGIEDGTSAKYKKNFIKFYVTGEKEAYISSSELYFSVPIDSPQMANQLFHSDLFGQSERESLANGYLRDASIIGRGMSWLRQHIQYFIEGVLGHEYRYIEVPGEVTYITYVISPNPGYWCQSYIYDAVQFLSGVIEYHGCIDAVDYFVSAIAHSRDESYRDETMLQKMLLLAEEVSARNDSSATAKEFAQTLMLRKKEILDNWAINS